jgi:nicotinamide mononucleotide transporter
MPNLFSVETVFFTVLDYPVSFIEFFGTVFYFASVWLIARRNILTWPIGLAGVLLYMVLFYQYQLYSDSLEQIYYLAASAYGWWAWNRTKTSGKVDTAFSNRTTIASWAAVTLLLGLALGSVMTQIHLWLPAWFPIPASLPWLDAMTTVMSLSAMWLLTLRRTETWIYWIIVDLAAIYVYFSKGIVFIGLQYIILTFIAIYGLISWVTRQRKDETLGFFCDFK